LIERNYRFVSIAPSDYSLHRINPMADAIAPLVIPLNDLISYFCEMATAFSKDR
jgi:hypothetical protein